MKLQPDNLKRTAICSVLAVVSCVLALGGGEFRKMAAQQNKPPAALSPRDVIGTWEGTLDAGVAKLRLVLHIAAERDGSLHADLDSPDQGAKGLPIDTVSVNGATLRFEMKSLGALYEGKVGNDPLLIVGEWRQQGQAFPLTFKRVGETPTVSLLKLERIDAGGHTLTMLIGGEGTPAVVFEGGFGVGIASWSTVQSDVAKFSRTVSYDRAGLMQSEAGPKPRSAKQIALELHTALQKSGIRPPYVLVGHSLGGIFIRVFADMYPKDVAGMVLIDPSQEAFDDWARSHQIAQPKDDQAQLTKLSQGIRDESAAVDTDFQQARGAKLPAGIPVILLTAMKDENVSAETRKVWVEKHDEWISKVAGGKHIKVEKSGHFIQGEQPQIVIDAIKQVIDQARRKMP